MAISVPAEEPAVQISERARLQILGAILLALFLFALDQTVVGVALPKIITDLKGNDLYTWAITIYLLTSTISGPIYGRLSDLFGRRPVIIFAVSLFLIASVGAGLSQTMFQFILFRGLQGLGGGAIFPVALAVVADLFTPAERGKYIGLFGAVFGLSSLVGPAIGGIITDSFSWHWIFFVNVPIGLVSLYVLWRLLPSIKHPDAAKNIDYLGAALFAAAIAPILIGLTNRQTGQWTDPWVGGPIVVGLVFLVIFLIVETRAKNPIVPLHLFRIRTFTVSVIAMSLAAFGFFAAVVFLPRWFQIVGKASATESGYNILPLLAGLIISAVASGQIVARTGRYKALMFGALVLTAVGLWSMTNLHATTPRPWMWLWMLLIGIGIGPTFAVFTLIVQNETPVAEVGVATGSLTFFQQIGGTIGLTLAGTTFASTLTEQIPIQLTAAGVPPELVAQFSGAGGANVDFTQVGDLGAAILLGTPAQFRAIVQPLIPNIVAGIYEAVSLAVAQSFWIGIGASLIAAVTVLFLREKPMRTTHEITETEQAPVAAAGMSA